MGRFGAACMPVLTGALPASAAELPSRKPGLSKRTIDFHLDNATRTEAALNQPATGHDAVGGEVASQVARDQLELAHRGAAGRACCLE
jgi:hypothetical protein